MSYSSYTVNVGATSTLVKAANSQRTFLVIINDSSETIYLAFGEDAVINSGIRLAPVGGWYSLSREDGNLTNLAVYGIHGGSGNKVICGVELS